MEVDEYRLKLELAEKEAQEVRADLDREVEAVRRQLLRRLAELEPLPERLKRTEQQLWEAEEQVQERERRSSEQCSDLSDLRLKVGCTASDSLHSLISSMNLEMHQHICLCKFGEKVEHFSSKNAKTEMLIN